jgi:hypothetical protein
MVGVLQKLPEVTRGAYLSLNLTGPTRTFGSHEIFHWWEVVSENGMLQISSGGYFHRPETGGDSFTSMSWGVSPGYPPEVNSYLGSLYMVDDADSFENEVAAMDLSDKGYELSVEDDTLEGWIENGADEY